MEDYLVELMAIANAQAVAPVGEAVYEAEKDLNDSQFFTVLGAVVDGWAARHNKSQKETFEIMENLARIQKEVHAKIGPATERESAQGKDVVSDERKDDNA